MRPADQTSLGQLNHGIQLAVPEYQEYHTQHLAPMQMAIARCHVLELTYRDKQGHATQRRVEPIGLVFYNFSWQLVAWCQLRQAYRQFRVARVQQRPRVPVGAPPAACCKHECLYAGTRIS